MSSEAFEHYLSDDSRRGPAPEGAFSGAAGGAPCGDLVRLSLAVTEGRVAATSFDAEGCAATVAAGSAAVDLVDGESVLSAARIGPEDLSAALGGLSPQGRHAADLAADALHRALGALASSGERLAGPPRSGERVLVALSGGVDSAVAALPRARARRRGGGGDAEALVGPEDRRRAELLLATGGGRRPGARASASACPTSRSTWSRRFAPLWSTGSSSGYAVGRVPRTHAWSATASFGSMPCSTSPSGLERGASRPATTRGSSTTATGPLLAARGRLARRTRRTCSPRCVRTRWPGCAFRSRS